jgi:ferric-dicitrate binding protein FerR (iron transport regulator)
LAERGDCNIVITELLQPQRRFVANWFVRAEDLQAGPFSETEFFDYLKDKDPSGVQIWREGMSAWVPAGDIPQLVELMAPARAATRPSRRNSAAKLWITVFAVGFFALAGIGAMIVIPHLYTARHRLRTSHPPPHPTLRRNQAGSAARISRKQCASRCRCSTACSGSSRSNMTSW